MVAHLDIIRATFSPQAFGERIPHSHSTPPFLAVSSKQPHTILSTQHRIEFILHSSPHKWTFIQPQFLVRDTPFQSPSRRRRLTRERSLTSPRLSPTTQSIHHPLPVENQSALTSHHLFTTMPHSTTKVCLITTGIFPPRAHPCFRECSNFVHSEFAKDHHHGIFL